MARTLIVLLLLAVCFLTGVVYGNGHTEKNTDDIEMASLPSEANSDSNQPESEEVVQRTTNKTTADGTVETDGPSPVTEKTASIIEAGVTGLYEVIVEVLYQISQLFF
ncbi:MULTISPECIES: hypothetical protein [Virgibacillus]|uniref:Uncharacterized protein n=2 Tax=Virgibacillus TaxID=84406 RepID=A0A024QAP2_9BACI|nr:MULTISPECIES: hypothetical protein [Virgibacillus]EQB35907.1 hypothetical protein M948_12770 [Virgibacillus sp. CM-4]MYL41709.1 hypothetical protein [Virgibacillus massiliensis]GGJ48208.1 hypothetical protein GCM10007111_07780 [Virgibacillus kapii]CDQ39598.1 hypothetical protein BN990_01903 [Virgibacillus massiliensis]